MKQHSLDQLILQLNTISRLTAMENAPESQKFIESIIENIRYKNDRKDHTVTVKDEMKAVSNLVGLMKRRFGDLLTFSAEVDPLCLNSYIPHYTLMTFVDNCVNHAFHHAEGPWSIRIRIRKLEGELIIKITDNGTGFDSKRFVHVSPETEYGMIANTLERLRNAFGDHCKVTISSSNKKGTAVSISIYEGE